MKKLLNLKGAKSLDKQEQKTVYGGWPPLPTGPSNCGCIVYNGLYLEIIAVDCNTTCPDGSTPVSGLGM